MKRWALLVALGCAACAGYAVEPPRDSGRFARPCGQRDPLGSAAELRTTVEAKGGCGLTLQNDVRRQECRRLEDEADLCGSLPSLAKCLPCALRFATLQ